MSEFYSYSPIDSSGGQIRLLTMPLDIKRKLEHFDAKPLNGTLTNHYLPLSTLSRSRRAVRVAQLPVFWALSYVWGSPGSAQLREIILDGKILLISENLHDALHAMHKEAYGDIRVWADAICICQKDVAERSAQIPLMREIYNIATDVKVWLGHLSDDRKRCLRFIHDLTDGLLNLDFEPDVSRTNEIVTRAVIKSIGPLVQGISYFQKVVTDVGDIIDQPARDSKAQMVHDPDHTLSLHDELIRGVSEWRPSDRHLEKAEQQNFVEIADLFARSFMQHEWFSRMWVVQELGVSNSTQFLIGGTEVSIRSFERTIFYLHFVRNIRIEGTKGLTKLTKISLAWKDGSRQPLRDLIRECRHRRATDPRDKIFSLLGLMGDPMSEYLRPDYSKSVGQIYANATRHFIQQYKSLDTICGWQTVGRQQDQSWELPSWAPDYTLDQSEAPAPLVPIDGRQSIYTASGYQAGYEYKTKEKANGVKWDELSTLGLRIGLVVELTDLQPKDASFASIERIWHSTLKQSTRVSKNFPKEGLELLERVSLLVTEYYEWFSCADKASYSIGVDKQWDPEHCDLIEAYIQTLVSGRVAARERATKDLIQEILRPHLSESRHALSNNIREDLFIKACNALESGLKKRRLAFTDTGYMGTVPHEAELSDVVCVIYGCSVPVLLRKRSTNGSYKFVGECYFFGLMDSEAVALTRQGVLHEETFVLS